MPLNPTQPVIIDKFIEGKSFLGRVDPDAGIQGAPRYTVVHIQEGDNAGSFQEFLNRQASATVLISRSGEIWRVIPEQDGPFTNGDRCLPTPRAQGGILSLGGNPNIWTLSIECAGLRFQGPTEPELNAIVWQIRTWMKRYGIPRRNIIRHSDINSGSGEGEGRFFCPGDPMFGAIMSALSPFALPGPIPLPIDGTDRSLNGHLFHAQQRTVTCAVAGLKCRQFAEVDAEETRRPLRKGEHFRVVYFIEGAKIDGDNRWWITKNGSRVPVSGTVERPS